MNWNILPHTLAAFLCFTCPNWAQVHRYEAETGQLFGTQISNAVSGYSGSGYVTGFNSSNGTDRLELQVDVPTGLYEMWVGYRSQYGQKGYTYHVDGVTGDGMFDQSSSFAEDRAGLFALAEGTNTLGITQSWGYYDVDYLEFRPFTPPELSPVSRQLSDSRATPRTQLLMNYLQSQYCNKTLSGQQHEVSQNRDFPSNSYLNKSGGLVPAIRGSDFMNYSPSRVQFGANPNNETEQTIQWAQENGGVVSMMWHWNAPTDLVDEGEWPWWRGFYTEATTFDLAGALANPHGEDYDLLLRDIDAIAGELQKFENAGVRVIWRPLHEAQGGWFWWGAHGPDTFKQLWNVMHDRLTNEHELHNLIWEFTSSAGEGNHLDWYPGDEVVDMIGLDIYTDPSSNMTGQWYDILEHYDGEKMIALSETGTLPDPDAMAQWGIDWSYFMPWNGFDEDFSAAELQHTLGHEDVITVDELPAFPWKSGAEFLGADFDFDSDVDGDDLAQWLATFGNSPYADANLNGKTDGGDFLIWQRNMSSTNSSQAASHVVPEPGSVALLTTCFLACIFRKRQLILLLQMQ